MYLDFLDSKKILPDKLRKIFTTYEWPGNVRQLQLELERLCLLSQGDYLEQIHCSRELRRHIAAYYEPKPIDTSQVHLSQLFEDLIETLAKNTHASLILGLYNALMKVGIMATNMDIRQILV